MALLLTGTSNKRPRASVSPARPSHGAAAALEVENLPDTEADAQAQPSKKHKTGGSKLTTGPATPSIKITDLSHLSKEEYTLKKGGTLEDKHLEHIFRVLFADTEWNSAIFDELGRAVGDLNAEG